MPLKTRFVVDYGPVACPLLGVGAAIGLLLSDLHCRGKWVQPALIVVLALLAVYMFDSLLFSYSGIIPRPNKALAVDGGLAPVAQIENERDGVVGIVARHETEMFSL